MSPEITIKTNRHEYELKTWHDLPKKEQAYFDYIGEDDRYSPRLVRYKGEWYDVGDMMSTSGLRESGHEEWREIAKRWHGYQSDSYFSGILVRYCEGFESVICATYFC